MWWLSKTLKLLISQPENTDHLSNKHTECYLNPRLRKKISTMTDEIVLSHEATLFFSVCNVLLSVSIDLCFRWATPGTFLFCLKAFFFVTEVSGVHQSKSRKHVVTDGLYRLAVPYLVAEQSQDDHSNGMMGSILWLNFSPSTNFCSWTGRKRFFDTSPNI